MADLQLKRIEKSFGSVKVIKGIDLYMTHGEFVVFVGPSGCGKSTLLRMIAGLEDITGGELYIDGQLCNDIAPRDRGIAMVFQSYALYPHMTVYENVGFALRFGKMPRAERDAKIREVARILQMEELLERKPAQLSGGQRQRVAIGRAIVRHPKAFLFDEPLSNLDASLRVDMRMEIARLHHELGRDDGLCHPRPDRGDDAGGQDRRARSRRSAAGRLAARALSPAGEPVRRRVHRVAQDEPAASRQAGRP